MKKFIKDKMGIDLDQPSTKKGLALISAGVALAVGHPDLLTANVTAKGIEYGGIIGTTLPILIGVWEMVRDESRK